MDSGTLTALIAGALVLAIFTFSYASARPGKSEIALRERRSRRAHEQMQLRALALSPADVATAEKEIRRGLSFGYCSFAGVVLSSALAGVLGAHGCVVLSRFAFAAAGCSVLLSWYSMFWANSRPCPCCGKSFLIKVTRFGPPDIGSGCQHCGYRFPTKA